MTTSASVSDWPVGVSIVIDRGPSLSNDGVYIGCRFRFDSQTNRIIVLPGVSWHCAHRSARRVSAAPFVNKIITHIAEFRKHNMIDWLLTFASPILTVRPTLKLSPRINNGDLTKYFAMNVQMKRKSKSIIDNRFVPGKWWVGRQYAEYLWTWCLCVDLVASSLLDLRRFTQFDEHHLKKQRTNACENLQQQQLKQKYMIEGNIEIKIVKKT